MAMNGSGVRDTMRVLKVGINTVIRTLKNSHQRQSTRAQKSSTQKSTAKPMNNGHSWVTRNANIGYGMPWIASGKKYQLMFSDRAQIKHVAGYFAYSDISNVGRLRRMIGVATDVKYLFIFTVSAKYLPSVSNDITSICVPISNAQLEKPFAFLSHLKFTKMLSALILNDTISINWRHNPLFLHAQKNRRSTSGLIVEQLFIQSKKFLENQN